MKSPFIVVVVVALLTLSSACGFANAATRSTRAKRPATTTAPAPAPLPFIRVAPDGAGFVREDASGEKFIPWGLNYDRDHKLRLLEDYWDKEWSVVEEDFREMRALGANVVRIHLQFGKFMTSPTQPNAENLERLRRLALFAEDLNLYLDITGLGSYRKRDVPAWYNDLDEPARWSAQANFWEAIARTLADRPGVFCYDLVNEPVVPSEKAQTWLHPFALANFHYVQHIVLNPAGRNPDDIARDWTRQMTAAIRKHDKRRLITIGLLPIKPADAEKSRGFVPRALKDDLDFIALHVYPESKKLDDALATVKLFDVPKKPLVIEEIFPLTATPKEVAQFIRQARGSDVVDGFVGFYWGKTVEEMEDDPGPFDKAMLGWLELFEELNPNAAANATAQAKATQPATAKATRKK